MTNCINCKSLNILSGAELFNQENGSSIPISFNYNPNAMIFKGTIFYKTRTFVCRDCGYVAVFCSELQKINSDLNNKL